MKRSNLIIAGIGILLTAFGAGAAMADPVNQIDGVAIHGFDPVAYFTQHKAVKGDPDFTSVYDGVTYEFASLKDQKLFELNPAHYVPQYGGFCAFGVSEGAKADIDPHVFTIKDGKLYLNYSEAVGRDFGKNTAARIEKADHNWSAVSQQDKTIR
jgi:YHS domain-containing protein